MNMEEYLMEQAKSFDNAKVMEAIKDPQATIRVLRTAFETTNNIPILIELLEHQFLDKELFEDIFNSCKEKKDFVPLLIKNKFCTELNFRYLLKEHFNLTYKCIKNSNFASPSLYIEIIEYARNNSEESILSNIYSIAIEDNVFNINVLKKILEDPKVNIEKLIAMLDKDNITNEMFNEVMNYSLEYFTNNIGYYANAKRDELINKIITHKLLTKDIHDMYVQKLKDNNIVTKELALSKFCTEEDLLNAIGIIKEELILANPNITRNVLLKMLNATQHSSILENIIQADKNGLLLEEDLIDAYKRASNSVYNDSVLELTRVICNHKKFSTVVLLGMINQKNMSEDKVDIIIQSKLTTEEKIRCLLQVESTFYKIVDKLIKIPNLTEDQAIAIFKKDKNNSIDGLVKLDKIGSRLFMEIINYLKTLTDKTKLNNYLTELSKKTNLSDAELGIIANLCETVNLMLDIMNNPNAGLDVVKNVVFKIETVVKNDDDKKTILDKAAEIKKAKIAKLYSIEEEEDVTEILRQNVDDGMSTMLWGPSGVGKTSRVFEIDPTATLLILKNGMLPEEVIGGKEPNGEPGEIYPPHWYNVLKEKCEKEPDRQHILFIDEFTNVSDTIKNLVWEVLGNRLVNGHEEWPLPDNCSIVVAGNRPEESTAVRLDAAGGVIPAPLQNRFDSMLEINFDIDEWQKWALETNPETGNLKIHPVVYSFCITNADKVMFTQYDPQNVTEPFLSPRRWEMMSKAIYAAEKRGGDRNHLSYARIKSILGNNDITNAFIDHYERLPMDMKKVENGEYKETDFVKAEDKLYALGMLIAQYKGDEMAVEDFILRCLGDEYLSVYQSMKNEREQVLNQSTTTQFKKI